MKEMFKTVYGDRRGALKVAVVVTDGVANMERSLTVLYAVNARNEGIYIVVMAVGTLTDTVMLHSIASPPTSKSVFLARSGRQLPDFRDRLFLITCDGTFV